MSLISAIASAAQKINHLGTGSEKDPMRPYYRGQTQDGIAVRQASIPPVASSYCCKHEQLSAQNHWDFFVQYNCYWHPHEPNTVTSYQQYFKNAVGCFLPKGPQVIPDSCTPSALEDDTDNVTVMALSQYASDVCNQETLGLPAQNPHYRVTPLTPRPVQLTTNIYGPTASSPEPYLEAKDAMITFSGLVGGVLIVAGVPAAMYGAYRLAVRCVFGNTVAQAATAAPSAPRQVESGWL